MPFWIQSFNLLLMLGTLSGCQVMGQSSLANSACRPCENREVHDHQQKPTCYEQAKTPVERLCCRVQDGQVLAMEELADRYHAGKGVPRILEKAAHYYTLAAHKGSPYAQYMLSILYAQGRGVTLDLADSVMWYQRAEKQANSALAQFKVAKRYLLGYGLPRDEAEAANWYALAAERQFAPAEIELGETYYFGRGREQDFSQAFVWYARAAQQQHPYGEYMQGLMLLKGQGVEANSQAGLRLIQKAAYRGARQAQYELGQLYLKGVVLPQSDVQAYAWLSIALKDMDEPTPYSHELTQLINRMHPKERAEAVKWAQKLEKQYGHLPPIPKI